MKDRGIAVPIDATPLPAWARAHLTEEQLTLDAGLQWITLIWQSVGLGATATSVAQRLYIGTIGKRQKKAWPSVRTIGAQLEVRSQTTVVRALVRLTSQGWTLKEERGPGRGEPGRGRAGCGYRLAWPAHDVLTPSAGPERCAQRTSRGGLCTRRAGYGTTTPGSGPCWRHGGTRARPPAEAPLLQPTPPNLQLLELPRRHKPVDKSHTQPPLLQVMLQPLQTNAPTVGSTMLQPLASNGPATGAEYVRSAIGGVQYLSDDTSPMRQAEVEGARDALRPGDDSLTIEQARQILRGLADGGAALILQAQAGTAGAGNKPTPEQLLLAAARAAIRRPA